MIAHFIDTVLTSPWLARSHHGCRQHGWFCIRLERSGPLPPRLPKMNSFAACESSDVIHRRGATVTPPPRGSTAAFQSRQLCCLRIKRRRPPARSNSHNANGLYCVIRVTPRAIRTGSTTCGEHMQSVQGAKQASGEQHYNAETTLGTITVRCRHAA